ASLLPFHKDHLGSFWWPKLHRLCSCLRSICEIRKLVQQALTRNLFSFFKRHDQYYCFFKQITKEINETDYNQFYNKMRGLILVSLSDGSISKFNNQVYERYQVISLFSRTPPKVIEQENSESKLKVIQKTDHGFQPFSASFFSPYLSSLLETSKMDQFFHVFLLGENIKERQDVRDAIYRELIAFFKSRYEEVIKSE
ncbi:MAG: hypothetical protein NC238_15915, partial [Dehalobacter sp.]|nr:hypothetical protein [Dehalobacter sp.]